MKTGTILLAAVLAALALPGVQAQETDGPPTATQVVGAYLQNIENKLVTAAKDFPEELYDYRPNEETRSFAEILLHLARSNDLILSRIEQRPPGDLKQFAYTNKAEAVAKLQASYAAVRQAIETHPDPGNLSAWMYAVTHASEHYGNLVTYYRANGLVPPASR